MCQTDCTNQASQKLRITRTVRSSTDGNFICSGRNIAEHYNIAHIHIYFVNPLCLIVSKLKLILYCLESPRSKPTTTTTKNTVIETQSYTASCSMNPNTNETIWYEWKKDGGDVGEETESGVLFIPSIKRTDAGNYTCRGRSVAGYSDSDNVQVVILCKYSKHTLNSFICTISEAILK